MNAGRENHERVGMSFAGRAAENQHPLSLGGPLFANRIGSGLAGGCQVQRHRLPLSVDDAFGLPRYARVRIILAAWNPGLLSGFARKVSRYCLLNRWLRSSR